MIRRALFTSAALVAFALAAPLAVQAQSIFISAGAAIPSGDDLSDVNTGWAVAGGVIFNVGENGIWAGVDGTYGRHSIDDTDPGEDDSVNPYSIMGVVGYSIPTDGNVDPYVYGGAGLQGVKVGSESESGFGFQGGAGVVFGSPDSSVRPYVEGRYQSASIDFESDGESFDVDVRIFAFLVGASIAAGN